jgi:hypothetical protein
MVKKEEDNGFETFSGNCSTAAQFNLFTLEPAAKRDRYGLVNLSAIIMAAITGVNSQKVGPIVSVLVTQRQGVCDD